MNSYVAAGYVISLVTLSAYGISLAIRLRRASARPKREVSS